MAQEITGFAVDHINEGRYKPHAPKSRDGHERGGAVRGMVMTVGMDYLQMDTVEYQASVPIGCLLSDGLKLISVEDVGKWLRMGVHAQIGLIGRWEESGLAWLEDVMCPDGIVRSMYFVEVSDMSKWMSKIHDSQRSKRTLGELRCFVDEMEEVVGNFYHEREHPPYNPSAGKANREKSAG